MDRKSIVDSVFKVADKGALLSFLKELALKNGEVAKEMESRFLKGLVWDYKKDISKAFDEIITDDYQPEYTMHDWDAISRNIDRILTKATHFLNSKDYAAAADVGLTVLEKLAQEYDYGEVEEFPYYEDYEIEQGYGDNPDPGEVSFIKDASDLVMEALTKGKDGKTMSAKDSGAVLSRFRQAALALSQTDSLAGARDALDCYDEYAKTLLSEEDYLRDKISMLDDGEGDETALEIYNYLKGRTICGISEASFAESHLKYRSVAAAYSADLENEGRENEALRVLEEHFGKEGPSSDHDDMSKKLYSLVMKTSPAAKREAVALKYFSMGSEKMKYYHDLKDLVPAERWPEVLKVLLSPKIRKNHYGTPEWLYSIYHEERMSDKLFQLIQPTNNGGEMWDSGRNYGQGLLDRICLLARYGSALTEDQVSNLVTADASELYSKAPGYDIKSYQTLVLSIKTLSKVNAEAKRRMEEFVSHLRQQYSRRRKLMEMLSDAFKLS